MLNPVNKRKAVIMETALITTVFIYVLIWKAVGFYFQTNDDRLIGEILSGALTGTPDAHAVYVNWLLCLPLSWLYKYFPGVPWYGLILLLFCFLVYCVLLYGLLNWGNNLWQWACLLGLGVCLIAAGTYMLSSVQFTSVAAMLAGIGYTCLLWKKKNYALFLLCELLAFLLRDQAMLMIQPIGFLAFAGICLSDSSIEMKKRFIEASKALALIVVVLAVGLAGKALGYQGQDWRDYEKFNYYETELMDFYGVPEYEEVKPILDRYGVSEAEYTAYSRTVIMDQDLSFECLEELLQYQKNKTTDKINIGLILKEMVQELKNTHKYMGMNRLLCILWGAVILWLVLFKRFYLLLPFGGIVVGRTFVWGYLIYRGRLPLRVYLPLICCEIYLLLFFLFYDYFKTEAKRKMQIVLSLFCLIFVLYSYLAGKLQYHSAMENEWQDIYIAGMLETQTYCNQHPENRYILDTWSFSYYQGSVLETKIYRHANSTYAGSWYSNSPVIHNFLKEYLQGNEDRINLIVLDEGSGSDYSTVKYFAEKLKKVPVEADRFTASHGGTYLIWTFE